MGSMGSESRIVNIRTKITHKSNTSSAPMVVDDDRPPVEPFVPSIEVKNRCQPDFSDLVGKSARDAEAAIKERRPDLWVEVIPHNTAAPPGVRFSRVRLFLDARGLVNERPIVQ